MKNKYNSGFTLMELLIGGAIATVTMLACLFFINQTFKSYVAVSNSSDNIIETLNGSAILKNRLSSAINIDYDGVVPLLPAASNLKGFVRQFDLAGWIPVSGNGVTVTIMTGFLDQLKSNATAIPAAVLDVNRFLPFSLFFQQPTTDKYGVIYLTIGTPTSVLLSPAQAQFQLDQIVDFSLKEVKSIGVPGRVSQFAIEFTRRSYKSVNDTRFKWCPPSFMSSMGCEDPAPYFETTEFINVRLRNNVLGRSTTQKQNIAGTVPPMYEGVPERIQTGVYYLSPVISWETLKR